MGVWPEVLPVIVTSTSRSGPTASEPEQANKITAKAGKTTNFISRAIEKSI